MKKCLRPAKADFKGKTNHVTARIILIRFKEGKNHIVYSPHLEVTGYGKTKEKAKESFALSLKIFFDYATQKKTLHDELVSLGWTLKKGTSAHPKKAEAPMRKDLIKSNPQLEALLSAQDISAVRQEIAIPL